MVTAEEKAFILELNDAALNERLFELEADFEALKTGVSTAETLTEAQKALIEGLIDDWWDAERSTAIALAARSA